MGAKASKKKPVFRPPMPPKPLTAVSEGEEQAWSNVPVDDDKDEKAFKSTVPTKSPKRTPKHVQVETVVKEAPVETKIDIVDTEEKEEKADNESKSMQAESSYTTEQSMQEVQVDEATESEANDADAEPDKVEEEPEKVFEMPVRVPTPDPLQKGAYLMFSPSNDGCLYMQYSSHKVEGALAYFRPKKVVPGFKFTQNHGRVELIRKLVNHKQMYFAGYADFLKAAKEFDSDVYMIEPVVKVYYQLHTSTIHQAHHEKFFPSTVSAVVVLPPLNDSFVGVISLSPENFVSTGNKHGKALRF
jgi:hypothetical protein